MKDDVRVHPETKKKIKAIAALLGYHPDPVLGPLLSAYRRAARRPNYRETVAWVTSYPTRTGWRFPAYTLYHGGAAQALERHGYRLEEFWLREPGLSEARASQILFNRGIRGLLISPMPIPHDRLNLDWKLFCSVTFGYTLENPQLHFVTASHYHAAVSCLRHLHAQGYRRIGIIISSNMDERMNRLWTAAYRAHQPVADAIEIHYLSNFGFDSEHAEAAFLDWFRTNRPEALVGSDGDLENCRRLVGSRVGMACLNLQKGGASWMPGVVEPSFEIGRAAGDFLANMLQRGERGVTKAPQHILLDGTWREGNRRSGRAAKKVKP